MCQLAGDACFLEESVMQLSVFDQVGTYLFDGHLSSADGVVSQEYLAHAPFTDAFEDLVGTRERTGLFSSSGTSSSRNEWLILKLSEDGFSPRVVVSMEGTAAKGAEMNFAFGALRVCGEVRMAGGHVMVSFMGMPGCGALQAVFLFELPPEVERFCRSILYIAVVSQFFIVIYAVHRTLGRGHLVKVGVVTVFIALGKRIPEAAVDIAVRLFVPMAHRQAYRLLDGLSGYRSFFFLAIV